MLEENDIYNFFNKVKVIIKDQDDKMNTIKNHANNGGFFEYMQGKIQRSKLEGICLALQVILEKQIDNIDDIDFLEKMDMD